MDVEEIMENMRWPRRFPENEGRILYALKNHQIIEFVLKEFLCRHVIGDQRKARSIRSLTMGKLISRFKEINGNTSLHGLLLKACKDRNLIAHQALVLQKPEMAAMIGVKALSIEAIREIDARAMKAMTETVCEFIRTDRPTSKP